MSVERITKKIIEDVEKQVQKIANDYEQKIADLKQKTKEEVEKIRIETENRIKYESQSIRERATTLANLEQKKKVLAAKWEVINEVFDSAAKKFLTLPEYTDIVSKLIEANTGDENSEVILSQSDLNRIKERLPKVKFTEPKSLIGGVIIRSEKIEKNFSLDAALKILKDELIIDLAKILFGSN
ncbi:MAG: V-type ATP synthase subunit E family protein [candidate division WOR-3 bacterium]|nr:V-type ATP synthase subunit E family protein [candidate division WOR-3 bacterium]